MADSRRLVTVEYLEEYAKGLIDQTYTPESDNAQSGKAVAEALSGYVKSEVGKGLSSNDFTNEDKEKLNSALQDEDIDQTYSPTSTNAQSGKAVSEAAQGVFDKVVKKYTRTGFKLLSTTLTESVNKIEFDNQGCDEIYIYGAYKKSSALGHVTVDAYFGRSKRDIIRSNNSVSSTVASAPFSFILKFGIPRPKSQNQYIAAAICGSNTTQFNASVNIRDTYGGIVPDKIVMTCSSEFAVGTEIFVVGVKTNG